MKKGDFLKNHTIDIHGTAVPNHGAAIGELIKSKQLSAEEYITAVLDNAEKAKWLHAFTYLRPEEAIGDAKQVDKLIADGAVLPLAGVAVGLKDFLPSKKGWPATHGGVSCMQTIDEEDSEFWKAAKKLGAIAIGKTNAPAFGFRGTTDNKMYGPTANPYCSAYNSGGSSGGSASAVGGGIIPLAEGGDAGGSIRIPASWCGCFGYKPSAGVVPSVCRPDAWTATHPYCCGGPIASDVATAAILAESMIHYNPRDPLSVPLPKMHLQRASGCGVLGLKIALTYNFGMFPDPDPEIRLALSHAAEMLRQAGATVEEVNFGLNPKNRELYENAWLRAISVDTAIDFELAKRRGNDMLKDYASEFPEEFIKWQKIALDSNMLDYRAFHEIRTTILDAHADIFDKYDAIIAPVSGCVGTPNGIYELTKGPESISGAKVNPLIGFGYTYLENMTGYPAASVPYAFAESEFSDLPIGIQVIAQRYRDPVVFAVSGELERIAEGV